MNQQVLYDLSQKLGALLQHRSLMLATAESCTGGYIAQIITAVANSSQWFERGFVTYSNEAKIEMLGVQADTLIVHGAVSGSVVAEMAVGALKQSCAHISVAVSGIAGPSGGSVDKPVGTVYFAIAGGEKGVKVYNKHFPGERQAVRGACVEFALRQLYDYLSN
ncbi:MAG: pncC [Gammaproteobacteria bacterium]|jgi:nicotinamide-nucleotide amidase|nr:pncC [Gammaproteobacteria bacterium]